jgi:DNA-binding MarR family transcriptional regulator
MAGGRSGSSARKRGSAIEEIVCRLDDLLRTVDEMPRPEPGSRGLEPDMIDAAARLLKAEQERAQQFGPDMFPNPGWAILLHLFVSRAQGRYVDMAAACATAGVAENVALRHVAVLVAAKLVRRQQIHADRGEIYLTLTPIGEERLCEYFNRAPRDKGAAAA